MGEIAEDILDGFLCENCWEVVDEKSPGYPRRCTACESVTTPEMKGTEHGTL